MWRRVALLVSSIAGASAWPMAARAGCESDADCKAGRVCQAGACAEARCTKDRDCPGDAVCNGGGCQALGGRAPAMLRAPNYPLAIAGGVIAGAIYMVGIPVTAAIGGDNGGAATGEMAIPLFGPFIVAATEPITNTQGVALGASAVLQAVGLTMLVIGLATDRDVLAGPVHVGADGRLALSF